MQVLQEIKKNDPRLLDQQPSHYNFDANELIHNDKARVKPAGEFEMPVMDNSYDLHAAPSKPNKVQGISQKAEDQKKAEPDMLQYLVHAANGLNIFTSGFAAIASARTTDKNRIGFLENISSFGAKLSMGVNSLFNILNGHKQKDLANVIGYSGELLVALLAPYNVLGLLRGVTFSTYQTSNILAEAKPMENSETYGEYLSQVKERYPLLIKKLFKADTYKNLSKNIGAVTGGWGSLLSYAGVAGWALTGSTKFGGWLKGVGEVMVDSYQVLTKEHWDCKRQFYIGSGLAFIMGSLCEIISKQKNNDPVTMALYFFGSGVGRLLYTISNILGESKYGPGGPSAESTPALVPNFALSKILSSSKPQTLAA